MLAEATAPEGKHDANSLQSCTSNKTTLKTSSWETTDGTIRRKRQKEAVMFQLTKTRSANYANLSPVSRTGFISPADPINCVVEGAALAAEGAAEAAEGAAEAAVEGAVENAVEGVVEAEIGQAAEEVAAAEAANAPAAAAGANAAGAEVAEAEAANAQQQAVAAAEADGPVPGPPQQAAAEADGPVPGPPGQIVNAQNVNVGAAVTAAVTGVGLIAVGAENAVDNS